MGVSRSGLKRIPGPASDRIPCFIHAESNGRRIRELARDGGNLSVADACDVAGAALPDSPMGRPAVSLSDDTMFKAAAEGTFRSHARHWKPSALKVNRTRRMSSHVRHAPLATPALFAVLPGPASTRTTGSTKCRDSTSGPSPIVVNPCERGWSARANAMDRAWPLGGGDTDAVATSL